MGSRFYTFVQSFLFLACILSLGSCVTSSSNAPKPVSGAVVRPVSKPAVPVLPPEQCRTFKTVDAAIPYYLKQPDASVVVTRLTKPCISRDGLRGFQPDTAWMAMGLPCAGGRGRIDIAGKTYNPKLITFNMGTECPMRPSEQDGLSSLVERTLGLAMTNTLLAYNPLAIQYWENLTTNDADFGTQINMRGNDDSLRNFWNDFKESKRTVKIRFFGRENAWVENNTMFKVEGDIKWQSPKYFIFVPQLVQAMTYDETQAVLQRCIASKASKACGEVF